jgi:hypothetical protein
MTPEALDALTTQTMRPKALDAVAAQENREKSLDTKSPTQQQVWFSPHYFSNPFRANSHQVQSADDSDTARSASDGTVSTNNGTTEDTPISTSIVSEVVQSVKSAIDSAITWAETKAESLSAEQDSTGPYASPATCMPSDIDVIASGILPAMSTARQYDEGVDDEKKEAESSEKSAKAGDGEDKNEEEQHGEAEPKL